MSGAAKALRWWVANAASWIAFGAPEPPSPSARCSRSWPIDPPDEPLLAAVQARAERRPWRPERRAVCWPWHYRAAARRLAREPGTTAAALADQLAADLALLESDRAALENARAELTVAVAGERIKAYGVRCDARGKPMGGGVAEPVPPAVFYNGDRTISPDGMVEPPPDTNGNTTLGDIFRPRGPYYRDVTFDAAEVRRAWPRPEPPKEGLPASTIGAEKRLEAWLTQQMLANPDDPPGKAAMLALAAGAGHVVADRAFDRAYSNAVKATGAVAWSAPGRKSKRRIETAG